MKFDPFNRKLVAQLRADLATQKTLLFEMQSFTEWQLQKVIERQAEAIEEIQKTLDLKTEELQQLRQKIELKKYELNPDNYLAWGMR